MRWNCLLFFWSFPGFLMSAKLARADTLWCYQCNADLSMGRREECNDPYAPGPAIDLVACPQNEPHHCLKALIYYKNVHATVRGCVPSRRRSTYCKFRDVFAEARVTCKFCNDYACNRSAESRVSGGSLALVVVGVVLRLVAIL